MKSKVAVAIILLASVLAGRELLSPGYFFPHDNLLVMRQLQMEKCFRDGQIPCRWVPDMGYGHGYPLFNFYPPLPYLFGLVIRLSGVSLVGTVKTLFLASLALSGWGMYLLAGRIFGRPAGVMAAIFYVWSPYYAVDIFVRGALNESWALIFFPFIFLSAFQLIRGGEPGKSSGLYRLRWTLLLALSWFGLLASHNLMVMVFAPFFLVWCIFWVMKLRARSGLPSLTAACFWALGLSAFFTLPALFEHRYTHLRTALAGYYHYSNHFADLDRLLFSRFWGYGPSFRGGATEMSFQIGHLHWVISLAVIAFFIREVFRKKISPVTASAALTAVVGWCYAFLIHHRSELIWRAIGPLAYLQFPWRLLAVVIFSFSFAAAFLIRRAGRFAWPSALAAGAVLIAFNWNYFSPAEGMKAGMTDRELLSGDSWQAQRKGGIYDYLPVGAATAPDRPPDKPAEFVEGRGRVIGEETGTDWFNLTAAVESDKSSLRINIFDFPGWRVYVDGNPVEHHIPADEQWGRIRLELPAGIHRVEGRFEKTPVRRAADYLSLLSWVGLAAASLILVKARFKPRC